MSTYGQFDQLFSTQKPIPCFSAVCYAEEPGFCRLPLLSGERVIGITQHGISPEGTVHVRRLGLSNIILSPFAPVPEYGDTLISLPGGQICALKDYVMRRILKGASILDNVIFIDILGYKELTGDKPTAYICPQQIGISTEGIR